MRLWEYDQDRGPCPFAADEQHFGSWPKLRDNADHFDNDLNIVIWWDWQPPDDDCPHDKLTLYVALPNRERVYPWSAQVSRDEEPEIRAWLQRRLDKLIGYWQIRDQAESASKSMTQAEGVPDRRPDSECPECFALVNPERLSAHEGWHDRQVEQWRHDHLGEE